MESFLDNSYIVTPSGDENEVGVGRDMLSAAGSETVLATSRGNIERPLSHKQEQG